MATLKTLLETALLKVGGVGSMPSTDSADFISISTSNPSGGYKTYTAPTDGWLCLLLSVPTENDTKARLSSVAGTIDSIGSTVFMDTTDGVTIISIPAKKGTTLKYYWGSSMSTATLRFLKSVGGHYRVPADSLCEGGVLWLQLRHSLTLRLKRS